MNVTAQTPGEGTGVGEGTMEGEPGMGAEWREQGAVSSPKAGGQAEISWATGGEGKEDAPAATCSLLAEQEPRLRPGEKRDCKRKPGSWMGDREQGPLSGREIPAGCGAPSGHSGALAGRPEARRRRLLRWG